MSNLNIILKSNNCEFTNFFREPIIIPANSEVAMVKANITVPVMAMEVLTMPAIPVANMTDQWITTIIDGIRANFTWRNLYDAWAAITGAEQAAGVTEGEFYSGAFQFFLNNPMGFIDSSLPGLNIDYKTSFQEAFGAMIDTGYVFYEVSPKVTWQRNDTEVFQRRQTNFIGAGFPYDTINVYPVQSLNWGITTVYNPAWADQTDEAPLTLDAADNLVWITAVPSQWTAAGGGVLGVLDNVYINNRNAIDPNGGWLKFKYNSQANRAFVGISIQTGNINAGGLGLQPASMPTPALSTIIDVGFAFTHVGGVGTYQIIDGHTETPVYNGVTIVDYAVSNLIPNMNYRSFNNNADWFYIQVKRDGLVSPSEYKYVVSLYRNDLAAPTSPRDTGILLYETTRTLASPALSVSPIFLSDGVGNQVKEVQYIPAVQQSFDQGNQSATNILPGGGTGQGQIIVENGPQFATLLPVDSGTVAGGDLIGPLVNRFYNVLGLNKFMEVDNPYTMLSNLQQPSNTPLLLKWERELQVLDKDCSYAIGPTDYSQIIDEIGGIVLTDPNMLTDLPRGLEVSLLDIPLKNISGNNPANTNTGTGVAQQTFETTTIDRIVGTIPTNLDIDTTKNFSWVLDYEPYTPIYRPLNNPVPLNISQMLVEVSYRDFVTGQKHKINTIDGTLNIELHIKPGRKPPPVVNNIRPF
jgi:hypothetical protein